MKRSKLVMISCLLVMGACGSKPNKTQALPGSPGAAASATAAKQPVAASPNVGVSQDLAAQCKLRFGAPEQAPKFDYNEETLLPQDRDVLTQVAECLARGPLKGRSVQLVGHTDPRGTDEYNLGLGSRRAESVSAYLKRLGVAPTQLSATTRGEVDASGVDESGWHRDRRVDLKLVN
ncbi:MAG: OmpA family protein [Kofleriaceae bacterium]